MNAGKMIESGSACSLRDLLSGNNILSIPDLQRDYCWGTNAWIKTEGKCQGLVSGFVENIISLFKGAKNAGGLFRPFTFGLIYGYELPKHHIQICDGQQRLTTLFLLLGYVNIKAKGRYDELIVSDQGHKGGCEPRLQYAIRESTLYFLSDLVQHVFLEQGTGIAEIVRLKKSIDKEVRYDGPGWYFHEYDLDASIQDMLAAICSIDESVASDTVACGWKEEDWADFGDFLTQQVRFLYYDMGSRKNGEDTYIVINTTGEPLSASENLKPILLGDAQSDIYSTQWEDREQWFWENRGSEETTDKSVIRFFVWYWQIGLLQEKSWKGNVSFEINPREIFLKEPIRSLSSEVESASTERWSKFCKLETLQLYFEALKKLVGIARIDGDVKMLFQSVMKETFNGELNSFVPGGRYQDSWHLNMLLPCLAFFVKYQNSDSEVFVRFLSRLRKNHFDYLRTRNRIDWDGRQVSESYVDWRHIIQLIERSDDATAVFTTRTLNSGSVYKAIPHVKANEWYSAYEQRLSTLERETLSEILQWGCNRALMGDVTPLLHIDSSGNIDVCKSRARWENFKKLSTAVESPKELASPDMADIANWYRLYRVATGIVKIQHQSYTPWNITGCHYSESRSSLDSTFEYVSRDSFVGSRQQFLSATLVA